MIWSFCDVFLFICWLPPFVDVAIIASRCLGYHCLHTPCVHHQQRPGRWMAGLPKVPQQAVSVWGRTCQVRVFINDGANVRVCAWFETVWMSKGCAVVSRCYKYNVWFSHDYSNSMTVRVVNASCYLIQPLWKDYVYTEIYTAYLCYIRTSFRLLDEYFVMLGWHTTNLY